jgi:ankyrin repeat protein
MHKATVNVETRDGRTPLFIAVENDQDDVVDLLLKYGAKPEPFLSSKKPQVDLHELFSSDITPGMFMRIVE